MSEIVSIVRSELGVSAPFDEDTPLISTGLVDSFGLPTLLSALERHYGIALGAHEVGVDNFDTPAQMWGLVHDKLAA
jgi:acyl carrier protein